MEIWKFNDPEPLRPFLRVLEQNAPSLAESARRLFGEEGPGTLPDLTNLALGLVGCKTSVRQAVRVLIFSPPVEGEIAHFSRLIRWLPHWLPSRWHDDPYLLRAVAELASSSEDSNGCYPMTTILQCGLKKRLRSWKKEAALLPDKLQPAARNRLLTRLINRLPYRVATGLRRRILHATDLSLGQIYETLDAARRLPPMGSLRHWRDMILLASIVHDPIYTSGRRRSESSTQTGAKDPHIISWGDRQPAEIGYLEKLISCQISEVLAVRRLAELVSRRTRSVVLTLHNASFGASTGWGMPSLLDQVSDEIAAIFVAEVDSLRREYSKQLSQHGDASQSSDSLSPRETVDNLFDLWSKRLVRPRLIEDLWTLRSSLLLNRLPMDEWELFFDQARGLLDNNDYQRLIQGKEMAIALKPRPLCSRRLHRTFSWYWSKKESHASFISFLWSLLVVGGKWLKAGRLQHFILPIIDKFFISSRRDQDLEYLPFFVQLAARTSPAPIFLLVDDTSRPNHASLQLAIGRWGSTHNFLGLGVFGNEFNQTSSPLETILASCHKVCLFALRPLHQVPRKVSFKTLLAQRPQDFLTPAGYDSSWKDNLPFLYQGTQVAQFVGPLIQADEYRPGVRTSAGPMAFGTYYRHKLQQLALKEFSYQTEKRSGDRSSNSGLEELWWEYAYLANLL